MTTADSAAQADGLVGKRIAVIHYGEHVPLDDGYRPARMGRLSQLLVDRGAVVERLVPTFSGVARRQRPESWSGINTDEGRVQMIPTPAFSSSRSLARAEFLRSFASGVGKRLSEIGPIDLAVVGYPPPGVVRSARSACGARTRIIADIRDLWPDAILPASPLFSSVLGPSIGKLLAAELRLADSVVSVSDTMLKRSPARNRATAIPIGVNSIDHDALAEAAPSPVAPMSVVFVGTLTQLFDFEGLFAGWEEFCADKPQSAAELTIYGSGDRESEVRALLDGLPQARFGGWVDSKDVPSVLASADVGVAPTRSGQGTTLSNKVLEYLSVGLHVAHSLEPAVDLGIESPTAACRVGAELGWADAFRQAECKLSTLRADRPGRVAQAHSRFGEKAINGAWLDLISRQFQCESTSQSTRESTEVLGR